SRAALQKDDLVVVGNRQQLFQESFGGSKNVEEAGTAVTHLQNAHAIAGEAEKFPLGLLQNRQRQHCRAGGEVEDALGGGSGGHGSEVRGQRSEVRGQAQEGSRGAEVRRAGGQ